MKASTKLRCAVGVVAAPLACLLRAGLFACWNLVDNLTISGVVHPAAFAGPSRGIAWDGVRLDVRDGSVVVPECAEPGVFGRWRALINGLLARRWREAGA